MQVAIFDAESMDAKFAGKVSNKCGSCERALVIGYHALTIDISANYIIDNIYPTTRLDETKVKGQSKDGENVNKKHRRRNYA